MTSYSTMSMLAYVLNESISSEGENSVYGGQKLSRRFLNRTFQDDLSKIHVDAAGFRRVELAVSYFTGSEASRQAFLVQRRAENFAFQMVHNMSETWPGGKWPPRNELLCGYRDENNHQFGQVDTSDYMDGSVVIRYPPSPFVPHQNNLPLFSLMSTKRHFNDEPLSDPSSDEDLRPLTKKLKATHLNGTGCQFAAANQQTPLAGSPPQILHSHAPSSSRTIIPNLPGSDEGIMCADRGPSGDIRPSEEENAMDTLEYEPELDQAANPFYYHPNRLLYEAHLERHRHGKS